MDEKFTKHIQNVNIAEVIFNRKEVSLEYEARKKMMRLDRAINQQDEEMTNGSATVKKDKKNDVVLSEAYNVLADLIQMTKGNELPVSKVNWMDLLINNL